MLSTHVVSLVRRKALGLGLTSKSVLCLMADYASDNGGGVWASKTTMAKELETTDRTIQRAIRALEVAGYVVQTGHHKVKNGATIEYQVAVDFIESMPDHSPRPGRRHGGKTQDIYEPPQDIAGDTSSPPTDGHLKTQDVDGGTQDMTPDTVSPPTDGHPTPDTVSPLPPTRCHPNQKVTKLNSVSADARPTHTFEDFWREHPRTATSRRSTAQDAFDRAVASGADPAHIVASARAYAEEQRGNASQYLAHAAAWLDARRWDDYPPPDPDADRADAIALARKMAKSPITSVSDTGRQMLRRLGESAA